MKFMRVHQKGSPVLVKLDTVQQIHAGKGGVGGFLVTDDKDNNLAVDERVETLEQYLSELEIEVELIANDL